MVIAKLKKSIAIDKQINTQKTISLETVVKCRYKLSVLADTRVNHTGVLAVSNYLGSSVAAAILTFVLNSLYGFNCEKINICSHFIT